MREEYPRAKLKPGNWNPVVKSRLEELIRTHAGQGKRVFFDFDNTLICRDIGEATFAAMLAAGKFAPQKTPPGISPDFTTDGKNISLKTVENITEYYDYFQKATTHQTGETAPAVNAYVWLIQIMAGMLPDEIVEFTKQGYANGVAIRDMTDPGLGLTRINEYLRPFFYPEMVDLVGVLLKHGFDVHIISASNVWTVRWMVLLQLNPQLQSNFGVRIPTEKVIGISVLMRDRRDGQLYKDPLLVRENAAYAALEAAELENYELTTQVVYPVSSYTGKVGTIQHYFSWERPILAAGDSPNDHAMLRWAENQLWIARLEKSRYQQATIEKFSKLNTLLLQPVLNSKAPGFVTNQPELEQRLSKAPAALKNAHKAIKMWQEVEKLAGF